MVDAVNPTAPAGLRIQKLVPQDALAYLAEREIKLDPTFSWEAVWQEEYAQKFTISRLTNLDLMQAINDELILIMQQGQRLADFQKAIMPKLQAAGWWGVKEVRNPESGEMLKTSFNPSRLKLIYDTNMSMANAAGKWARAQANKERYPYLVYITQRDERVRKSHAAWEGIALAVDHPFWLTHFPPNGWMCRCYVISADEKMLARLEEAGIKIRREPPDIVWRKHVNRVTGEVTQVPVGIDPGFAYNVGVAAQTQKVFNGIVMQKLTNADALLSAMTAKQLKDLRYRIGGLWEPFFEQAIANGYQAKNSTIVVDVLSVETVKHLVEYNVMLDSAVSMVRDAELMHAWRNSDGKLETILPQEILRSLPDYLQDAELYLDTADQALIYVINMSEKRSGKVVFAFNYQIKTNQKQAGKKVYKKGNVFRSGGMVAVHNLLEKLPNGELRYQKLRK